MAERADGSLDEGLRYRPKSIVLVYLIEHHPAALEYDWQTRFRTSITQLRDVGWKRAWWWTSEILRDQYSHTASALRGDARIPHPAEEAAIGHLEGWINAQLAKGSQAVQITRPWAAKPPQTSGPKYDPSGKKRRRALLDKLRVAT